MIAPSLYVDRETPLHRLSARATLALALAASVAAYVFDAPSAVGAVLAAVVVALLSAGGWRNLRRMWYVLLALVAIGFVLWPTHAPAGGPTVVSLWSYQLSMDEFRFALGRSMRIATFLVVGLTVVTTTSTEELVNGLRALGFPFAVCFAVGTALRLVPVVSGSIRTVQQAQAARGFEVASKNPLTRLRNYGPLLIPAFVTAFRRIESQSIALESRGFSTRAERTFYDRRPLRWNDWGALVLAGLVGVGAVLLSAHGVGRL